MKKKGAKELSDLLDLIFETSIVFVKHLKDGVDWTDVVSILTEICASEDFRDKIAKASKGASEIPAEIKEMGLPESMLITGKILPFITELVETLSDEK